jgi:DNA-binding beta-propeller fold protein YncE
MRRFFTLSTLAAVLGAASLSAQADDAAQKRQTGPRNYAGNLDNPSGIAIHPETGHVFVAERRGVVRFYPNENAPEGKRRRARAMEVNKFPTDIYGKGPMYDIGPLGLAWLDNEHLIVGDGSRPDGQELVRIYKISATPAEKPAAEDSAVYTLGPIKAGDESVMGEGNFYGLAVAGGAIFVTCNGDDTKGWVSRAVIENGKPGELKPYIATKPAVEVDAPVGITVSKEGDLVIGQMGEVNVPGDSLLTIYDPKTGKLKASYETGLSDIAGLAYSPATGKLYAVDFAWQEPAKGGLFELTIEGDECNARKVVELDKPTAIAFDKAGNAFVTIYGTAEEGAKQKPGKVVRIGKKQL